MSELRAAVIGVGSMGANHVRVYAEMEGVRLVAVADSDADRLPAAARGRALRTYEDYRQMLASQRLDLVSIAVPTRLHREVALAALERGVAALVEKPLAPSVEEGRPLLEAAQAAGVPLMVGHVERFNPAVRELKRRLEAGALGRVLQVQARRVGPFPQRTRDVGVVQDLAAHDIDIMRHLLGAEVEHVFAETQLRVSTEHEDLVSAVLRFRDGAVGLLDVNWLTPTKVRELTVLGERGMFALDYLTQELLFYARPPLAAEPSTLPGRGRLTLSGWSAALAGPGEGAMERIPIEKVEPLRAELEAFVAWVRGAAPCPVAPEDALAALEVAERIVESGRRGQVVAVGQPVAERGD